MRAVPGAALTALLALTGCGAGPPPDPGSPTFTGSALMALTSAGNQLAVEVRSSPQPPSRGLAAFEFTITDAKGSPASGLTLRVQPWMPDMGHGSSIVPTVAEVQPGIYQVTQVYFSMPGTWQLRTTVSGPLSDSFLPEFQIP